MDWVHFPGGILIFDLGSLDRQLVAFWLNGILPLFLFQDKNRGPTIQIPALRLQTIFIYSPAFYPFSLMSEAWCLGLNH
jgi:hypothetical protein